MNNVVREALETIEQALNFELWDSVGSQCEALKKARRKCQDTLRALDNAGIAKCSEHKQRILQLIYSEHSRAVSIHGRMNGPHEAYAVILEEVDELWDEVRAKKLDRDKFTKECIQIAAMCVRAILEVGEYPAPSPKNGLNMPPPGDLGPSSKSLFDEWAKFPAPPEADDE